MKPLVLALPSKGRLMEGTEDLFTRAGLQIERGGTLRNYRGTIGGVENIEIAFLSAPEVVEKLRDGTAHAGITGEDLLRDAVSERDPSIEVLLRLGIGPADVVVAVPESWLDVASMQDLDEVAALFHIKHARRLRVATKFMGLTRRFFADKGVTGYRIVESSGATEGAPATGAAEIIVDITTTGSTLKANHLKVLDDGLILRSEAVLAVRREVKNDRRLELLRERLQKVAASRGVAV